MGKYCANYVDDKDCKKFKEYSHFNSQSKVLRTGCWSCITGKKTKRSFKRHERCDMSYLKNWCVVNGYMYVEGELRETSCCGIDMA